MTASAINFLHDFYQTLYERASEARSEAREARRLGESSERQRFAEGRALAYYEVVATFIDQAKAFNLDPRDIGFDTEDSERLLP